MSRSLAVEVALDRKTKRVFEVFRHALDIVERIRVSGNSEYTGLEIGLSGGYVEPGYSGALTRGKIEVLPTGRNFFAVDPTQVPSPSAWRTGVESANKLLEYYLKKHGRYPESVGQVLWSIDAYKADGEQLAQILYLVGVEPLWDIDGSVKDLRVIPLEVLKRPRIDVLVRISGIVRDTLPNYVYLIDSAISKVIALDEPLEMNYVKKHYYENIEKMKALNMGSNSDIEELARARVFSDPPGAYGAGVNYAIEASAWKTEQDLAKVWVQWAGYAYTKRSYGKQAYEALAINLRYVDIVSKNHVSDEHDIFDCCCYFAYYGGFYNAAKAISGKDVVAVTVDTRDVSSVSVRDMAKEIERVVRAKLLNPVWLEEMKKHGYRGANELQRKILHLYGWSATTRLVDKWVFDEIAKRYVLDEEMRRWFTENNPWAIEEIARRLIEAAERGLWRADRDTIDRLREVYGEIEGVIEDTIVSGDEIQGSSINVYSIDDVEDWRSREEVKRIEGVWRSLRNS